MSVNLVFFKKDGRRKDVRVKTGTSIVGRRADCDIRIPTTYVSRKHCRIVCQDEKTVVQDLGSANGVYLNSEKIMEGVVSAGDRLTIGNLTFTVQVDGIPENIHPRPRKKAEKSSAGSGFSHTDTSGTNETLPTPPGEFDPDSIFEMDPLSDSDADLP
ncbi:MAG: FHA domain-containing protein [Sedimentisphaerales bacterium]|nr:FHA domain-containing protein [Sedimentisphaerales bacterium]